MKKQVLRNYVILATATLAIPALLYGVYAIKLYESHSISLKPILLNKEWHHYAVNTKYEIIGINTVEHIIVHTHCHLALYSVRLTYQAYLIYFLVAYQCCYGL